MLVSNPQYLKEKKQARTVGAAEDSRFFCGVRGSYIQELMGVRWVRICSHMRHWNSLQSKRKPMSHPTPTTTPTLCVPSTNPLVKMATEIDDTH